MSLRRALVLAALSTISLGSVGCAGARQHTGVASPATPAARSCQALAPSIVRFGETLLEVGASTNERAATFAGLIEVLVTVEGASADLEAQLAASRIEDPELARTAKELGTKLADAANFAKAQRERIEGYAAKLSPTASESDSAFRELRSMCSAKRPARECAAVLATLDEMASAATYEETRRITTEKLAPQRIATPALAKARDRAVTASNALAAAIKGQAADVGNVVEEWKKVFASVSSVFERLAGECKDVPFDASGRFVADDHPDPRKLTVLVHAPAPSAIELPYTAFGSGFIVVRTTADGRQEPLVITNRHVVELADKAILERADGTKLGAADILYTDSAYDIAILRPREALDVKGGFAFAAEAPHDQEVVVATGFPGMAGRPSYQTTRGYVSNEAFKVNDGARELAFVQHTAPIDPGSSGGPLTDEHGDVIGVNTLKVTDREAVGLAIPAASVLEAIRRADAAEAHHASSAHRKEAARLACLAFVGEIAASQPRWFVLEHMIANAMTITRGPAAAKAIAAKDQEFVEFMDKDALRAMRAAALSDVQDGLARSGGASGLETCTDAEADKDEVRFHIRTRSFDKRAIAFRWEHGRYKLASIDLAAPVGDVAAPVKGTAKAKTTTGASKRAAPTSSTPRPRS